MSFGATRHRSKHRKASLVTVTVIDPKIALVVIDLQKGFASLPTVHPFGDIVNNASVLADAFRRHRLPVVLVNVDGSALTNTCLETHLKSHGVTQLVISGASTSAGVESTARHASELGFNVVLAVDAITDMDADVHYNSVTRIFPKLGETGTTAEFIDLLETSSAAR
jgi:nicotinamidase-related amidase